MSDDKLVERRGEIRNIIYRHLPQEIDANICRAIADEILQSERASMEGEIEKAFTAGFDAACRHYLLPTGPNNRGILAHELDQYPAPTSSKTGTSAPQSLSGLKSG